LKRLKKRKKGERALENTIETGKNALKNEPVGLEKERVDRVAQSSQFAQSQVVR
jgi:hypothetical protein